MALTKQAFASASGQSPVSITLPGTPQSGDRYVIIAVSAATNGNTRIAPDFASGSGTGWTTHASWSTGFSVNETGLLMASKAWVSGDATSQTVEASSNKWLFIGAWLIRPGSGNTVSYITQGKASSSSSSSTDGNSPISRPVSGDIGLHGFLNNNKATIFTTWYQEIDGATQPPNLTEDAELTEGSGGPSGWSSAGFASGTLNTATSSFRFLVDHDDTGSAWVSGGLIFREATSGTAHQETITDAVGVTDSVSYLKANVLSETITDVVGVTDSVSYLKTTKLTFQTVHPDSDINAASWTSTPLWSKVDEAVPSDTDYIESDLGDQASTSKCELGLPTVANPGTFVHHRLRIRGRQSTGTGGDLRGTLTDGTNSIDFVLNNIPTTFTTYEFDFSPRAFITGWDYSNLSIKLYGTPAFFSQVRVQVSWVELEFPPSDPSPLSLDACKLPSGDPGPVVWDGKTWLVAVEKQNDDRLWLFSADNPSDGHNPTDWVCRRLASSAITVGDSIAAAAIAPNQAGTYLGVTCLGTSSGGWYQRISPTTWKANDLVNPPGKGDYIAIGYRSNGDVVLSGVPSGSDYTYGNIYDHDGTGFMATYNTITANLGEVWPFSAIQVGNRTHYFIRNGTSATGQLALYTLRANNTVNRGSIWTTTDVDVRSIAAGVSNDIVVGAFRRTNGTGIDNVAFTDADTPTTSLETTTTQDAQKAEYVTTPACVVNDTNIPFAFWIDDANSDAIFASHRTGASTWVSNGEVISGGGNSWDTISAHKVALDTAGLLVAADSGLIHYYEVPIQTSVSISHTVDALLQETFTKTHTVDAYIGTISSLSHTVDAVLVSKLTVAHTVDAIIGGEFEGWGIPI